MSNKFIAIKNSEVSDIVRTGEVWAVEPTNPNMYTNQRGMQLPKEVIESETEIFKPEEEEATITVTFSKSYDFNPKEIKGMNVEVKMHNAKMMATEMLMEDIPILETKPDLLDCEVTESGMNTKPKKSKPWFIGGIYSGGALEDNPIMELISEKKVDTETSDLPY